MELTSTNMTAGWLIASFLVGSVGLVFFLYGKKQLRIPQLTTGLALMIYPYFITSPIWMIGICAVMVAGLWAAVRAGW